jgi:hypothetical protein
MKKVFAVLLMCANFNSLATESSHSAPPVDPNYNMSLIAGGIFGVVLASGAVGLITASSMVLEGAGVTEAMEAGAGLTMPLAVLSAILGGFFTQEFMLKSIKTLQLNVPQGPSGGGH